MFIFERKISVYLFLNLLCLFLLQQFFAYAIGVIFGVVNIFYRDVREFLSIFMNIWFWMTPIVWVPSIAPQWLQNVQSGVNPYYWFLEEYREIFLNGNASQIDKIFILHNSFFCCFFSKRFICKKFRKGNSRSSLIEESITCVKSKKFK